MRYRIVWCSPERLSCIDQEFGHQMATVETTVGLAKRFTGLMSDGEDCATYYLKDHGLSGTDEGMEMIDDPIDFEELS